MVDRPRQSAVDRITRCIADDGLSLARLSGQQPHQTLLTAHLERWDKRSKHQAHKRPGVCIEVPGIARFTIAPGFNFKPDTPDIRRVPRTRGDEPP